MSKIENAEIINTHNISFKYGLASGIVMSAILILFQLAGNDYSPFLKLSKYLVLAVAIVGALTLLKENSNRGIFINGIGVGTKLSLIAAISIVLINTIIFFISPELAFSKYSLEPTSIDQSGLISGILFFETFVFGSLISFITLQYLKFGGDPTK